MTSVKNPSSLSSSSSLHARSYTYTSSYHGNHAIVLLIPNPAAAAATYCCCCWERYITIGVRSVGVSCQLESAALLNDIHVSHVCLSVWSCQRPRVAVPGQPQEERLLASFLQRASWPFCNSVLLTSPACS